MISVGSSSDGRKRLALAGFGGGGGEIQRKMEEAELEEGEACSSQNGDDDVNIDPDVALSYIDEKLQSVLGHFKKDFEGGISYENLEAKYGGYGSFLTQKSPVRSSSRSPSKVQISHTFRPPNSLKVQQGNRSTLGHANGPHSMKHAFISSSSSNLHAQKASLPHDPPRQSLKNEVRHASKEPPVRGSVAEKSANIPDQRTLKVRIKVGPDNMSAKKNADICSELGLDDSPSSSFDGSPMDFQGMPQVGADDSPTHIIHIMTSFPICGGHLLSPLPEGLARLTEKLLRNSSADPVSKRSMANDVKLVEKAGLPKELKKVGVQEPFDGFDQLLNEEADFNALVCEDLVSKALKLPLLSSLHDTSGEHAKEGVAGLPLAPSEGNKNGTASKKSNLLLNKLKQESLEPSYISDDDLSIKQNRKVSSGRKVSDVRKVDMKNDASSQPARNGDGKGEPANSSTNSDVKNVGSKGGGKVSNTNFKDSHKQRIPKMSTSFEKNGGKLHPGSKHPSSKGKKKHKGSQFNGSQAIEIPKLSVNNGASGSGDSTDASVYSCKNEIESISLQKDLSKPCEMYKDFFGEIDDEGDDLMDSPNMPLIDDRLKTPHAAEEGILQAITPRERSSSKKTNVQSISRVRPNQAPNIAYPSNNGPPIGNLAPAETDIQDEWVCCDKCLKWRLLPMGFVETLPDKWLCSMLSWLPGKNSCSVTEEETTRAVRELYQVPAQNVNGLPGSLAGVVPEVPASHALHGSLPGVVSEFPASNELLPQQHSQDLPGRVRKNHALKEVKSLKPVLQNSVKSKSLADHFGSGENELHFQQMRSYVDAVSDTSQRKNKGEKKSLSTHRDAGQSKNKKLKNEKEPYRDHAHVSKKMKTVGTLSADDNLISSHEPGNNVFVRCSSNVPSHGAGSCQLINHESSPSRTSKCKINDVLPDSTKKLNSSNKASLLVNPSDTRKLDSDSAAFKRKAYSSLSALSPNDISGKAVSEDEQIRPKKARISMPTEKNSSSSRGSGKAAKKVKSSRGYHQSGTYGETVVQRLEENGSMKKDLGSSAISSSSKVSGSHESKSNLHEVKGSPVESVSSSPFRTVNYDRYMSKNVVEKDNVYNVSVMAKNSSRKQKDSEDDRSVSARSGTTQMKLLETSSRHGYAEPSILRLEEKNVVCFSEATGNASDDKGSGHRSRRSMKDSSLLCMDKNQKLKSPLDNGKSEASEYCVDLPNQAEVYKDKPRDNGVRAEERFGPFAEGNEEDYSDKKSHPGNSSHEIIRKDSKLKSIAQEDVLNKADALCNRKVASLDRKKEQSDSEERNSKFSNLEKAESVRSSSEKKPGNKTKVSNRFALPHQENVVDGSTSLDAQESAKASEEQVSVKKADSQNGMHSLAPRHSNGHRVKERDAPSPMRRDSHSQAAQNALKEAKDLKHLADRQKHAGSIGESTGFYLQASLKFLHGASLLEISSNESVKRGAKPVYSSTAKLCEFCAHEYEKSKNMAAAALAYKCMEVAYLRVIYSSHPDATRDRHELQASLQMVPGKSPSSSASDVDNTNNPTTTEKIVQVTGGNSPQTAGNHVIAARNRPNFSRLLNFMQDVNSAMEASRKAQNAFAAAKIEMQERKLTDEIRAVKRALDFNFHDVEGLLRLVRLATDAIIR